MLSQPIISKDVVAIDDDVIGTQTQFLSGGLYLGFAGAQIIPGLPVQPNDPLQVIDVLESHLHLLGSVFKGPDTPIFLPFRSSRL